MKMKLVAILMAGGVTMMTASADVVVYSETFENFAVGSVNDNTPMMAAYTTTGLNTNTISVATLSFDIVADMGDTVEWLSISANGIVFQIKDSGVYVGDDYTEQHFEYNLTVQETESLVGSGSIDWVLSFGDVADFGPGSPWPGYPQEYVTYTLSYEVIPEPATLGLMGFSTLGLFFYRRRGFRFKFSGVSRRSSPQFAVTKKAEAPAGYVNPIKPRVSKKEIAKQQWLNF